MVKAGSVKQLEVDGDLLVDLEQVSLHVQITVPTIQGEDVENEVIEDSQEQV